MNKDYEATLLKISVLDDDLEEAYNTAEQKAHEQYVEEQDMLDCDRLEEDVERQTRHARGDTSDSGPEAEPDSYDEEVRNFLSNI